jgi:hypothetical protein
VEVLAVFGLVTLVLATRGSWWAAAIPGVVVGLGVIAYLTSEPDPPWGGDSDPDRLIGVAFLTIGVPWLVVALLVVAVSRAIRGADGRVRRSLRSPEG